MSTYRHGAAPPQASDLLGRLYGQVHRGVPARHLEELPMSQVRRLTPIALACVAAATLGFASTASAMSSRELASPRGTSLNEYFGGAVAVLDFNKDGIPDIVVGSPESDAVNFNGGRLSLFYGPNYTTPVMVADGLAGERLGASVASAGDVNGDGAEDLIVGAPGDQSVAMAGRAYIYYGGTFTNLGADLTLFGENNFDSFGASVAGVDLNRDGYSDVVVGAPLNDANGTNAGKVYVYLGGSTPNNVLDFSTTFFSGPGDGCGWSMAPLGDLNGDGYPDVAVGMPFADVNANDAGAVNVMFGNSLGYLFSFRTYRGTTPDQLFGWSVGGAGDMNGDGFADLIVGAKGDDSPVNNAGAAYVFFGGPGADVLPDWSLHGNGISTQYGMCVAGAGDVNGDGYADAMFSGLGGVAIILGGYSLSSQPTMWVPLGSTSGDVTSLASAGDVDGDGNADILIGDGNEYVAAGPVVSFGRMWLRSLYYYQLLSPNGGETLISNQNTTVRFRGHDVADLWLSLDGGATWSILANNVGGDEDNTVSFHVPDVSSDHCRLRVVVAGSYAVRGNHDESSADFRIVPASTPPLAANHLRRTFTGAAAGDQLGGASCGADFNGDGFADVAVGVTGSDVSGVDAGQVLIYFGGPAGDAVADLTLNGAAAGDNFGVSVRPAGDVNHDGYVDLIVGANNNDAAGSNAGRAYVYFGGPTMDAVADWTLTGETAGDGFGFNACGIGDINRDGYADVLVGAPFNDFSGADAGRAYVYYGGPAPDATVDLTLYGEAAGDNFGTFLSDAGDVNADGYPDWLVGAFNNDAGGSNAGRAYLFFGGAAPDRFPDLLLTGAGFGSRMGSGLAGPGDWDGDGYDDFVVGAYQNSAGASAAGRVYIYRGGPAVDATADYLLTSTTANEFFGYSAGGVGDVNGDGFADLAVGGFAGKVYIYCGGPAPDVVADYVISGASADGFAQQLGSAGDVDGDGFNDLILGAPGNDAAASNAGRAYLYDFNRYVVTAPNGGETWNVGAMKSVSWLGAVPADVSLSLDGGATWNELAHGVGGAALNSIQLRVPHQPTKFARVKVMPSDAGIRGSDISDSLFTIQTSISLLSLTATFDPTGGATVIWSSDPGVGPEGLAGYRVYRTTRGDGGAGTRIGPDLILETRVVDAAATAGSAYRLVAVNGLMEELELGRVALPIAGGNLSAWPVPLASGRALHIEMAAPLAAPGFAATDLDIAIFDLAGRRVTTIAHGPQEARNGMIELEWRPDRAALGAGLYFLRASAPSAGWSQQRRCVLVR
jgi:FG-GAP repeat/FG-GAP-like repeat